MILLFGLICLVVIAFLCLLTTFVFCFWFVYLLDAIRRKWKFYKNELRCLQQENFDSQQQILVYNAKTEFVKNVFLFFMNIIEWLTLMSSCTESVIKIAEMTILGCQEGNKVTINITNSSHYPIQIPCIITNIVAFRIPSTGRVFISLTHNCAVLSLVLIASLCMYLANRLSQCSWITSSNIPYLISLCILYQVVYQIIASFCSFLIIAEFFYLFLFTVSTLFALKQYRKLLMVINWTIVDLRVNGNNLLLKKQIRMKRTFTRIFTLIWIGIILILVYYYIAYFLFISGVLIRSSHSLSFDIFLCEISHVPNSEIFSFITNLKGVNNFVLLIGIFLVFIQYTGFGLSNMSVILWRLCTGKSGYRTHFHNDLYAPLV